MTTHPIVLVINIKGKTSHGAAIRNPPQHLIELVTKYLSVNIYNGMPKVEQEKQINIFKHTNDELIQWYKENKELIEDPVDNSFYYETYEYDVPYIMLYF
jgi:hypothetical protein